MACIVEMDRGDWLQPNWEQFDCHKSAWEGLLALAKTYGWEPQGSVPYKQGNTYFPGYLDAFKNDYVPGHTGLKGVSAEDAQAMCQALKLAIEAIESGNFTEWQTPHGVHIREGDDVKTFQQVNATATGLLEQFVEFASGGAFRFGWDD